MKVINRGVWGYRQDDTGLINGIWVEDIGLAQLDDDYKPNLRMLLSWMSIDPATGLSSEQCGDMYAAVASNKLHVLSQDPAKGGGFWVVMDEQPKGRRKRSRPWWKFW
ncbi:MAG TPA: hypothetical protein PLB81_10135 [Deltaproteobacteria bacterium]|nr:hypothetical protein [Deltaproteobacteria bacterium]